MSHNGMASIKKNISFILVVSTDIPFFESVLYIHTYIHNIHTYMHTYVCPSIHPSIHEGKSVIWFGGLYRLWKSLHFCQKLTTGNLEIIKYKITGLKHSQLPTGILQKKNIMPYWTGEFTWPANQKNNLLATKIRRDSKAVRNYWPVMCLTTCTKP